MKTLIVYASSHGTTRKVVDLIAQGLSSDEITIVNLKKEKVVDLDKFDMVVVGGSIHAGTIQKSVRKFVDSSANRLENNKIALFVCGMDPHAEKQKLELETAFPLELREKAIATGFLGGEFLFEKMNFLERMIIKKIAKTDQSVSSLNDEAIENFISILKS